MDVKRYYSERKLGAGGMASVYLATDTKLERKVAIKMLHEHLLDDPNLKRRLMIEAKSAASLAHENIVAIHDAIEEDGTFQLVMEYIDGVNLDEFFSIYSTPPPLISLEILRQLCEGLAAAHHKGIVHRDIKPGNLLLDKRGLIKITDFGLAQSYNFSAHTQAGQFLGTAQYCSPEAIKAEGVSFKSDLFSAGCVFYRSLTGKLAFDGENPHEILVKICDENPSPPAERLPEAFPFVSELAMLLLHKDVNSRPSAYDVVKKISDFDQSMGLGLGSHRLRRFQENPAEYLQEERDQLARMFSRLANEYTTKRKAVLSQRAQYYAGIFSAPARIDKSSPKGLKTKDSSGKILKPNSAKGKRKISWALGLVACVLLVITLSLVFFKNFLNSNLNKQGSHKVEFPESEQTVSISEINSKEASGVRTNVKLATNDSAWQKLDAPNKNIGVIEKKVENFNDEIPIKKDSHPAAKQLQRRSTTAYLLIKSRPPLAEILVDGNFRGKSPLHQAIEVSAGTHQLELKKQGLKDYRQAITIGASDTLHLAIDLVDSTSQ